jgi:hypothetical protein
MAGVDSVRKRTTPPTRARVLPGGGVSGVVPFVLSSPELKGTSVTGNTVEVILCGTAAEKDRCYTVGLALGEYLRRRLAIESLRGFAVLFPEQSKQAAAWISVKMGLPFVRDASTVSAPWLGTAGDVLLSSERVRQLEAETAFAHILGFGPPECLARLVEGLVPGGSRRPMGEGTFVHLQLNQDTGRWTEDVTTTIG